MVCPKPGPTAPLPFFDNEAPTRGDAGISPNGCLPLPRENRRQPQGRNRGPRRAGTRHC